MVDEKIHFLGCQKHISARLKMTEIVINAIEMVTSDHFRFATISGPIFFQHIWAEIGPKKSKIFENFKKSEIEV